jgi:hypothetical protein
MCGSLNNENFAQIYKALCGEQKRIVYLDDILSTFKLKIKF